VDMLVRKGFHLLLPFVLLRHRKGKITRKRVEAFLADLKKIEGAIAHLYESGQICANLRADLYATIGGIVRSMNMKYLNNDQKVEKCFAMMITHTTYPGSPGRSA